MATTIPRHVGRRSCMGVAQSRSCCKLFFIHTLYTHTHWPCLSRRGCRGCHRQTLTYGVMPTPS